MEIRAARRRVAPGGRREGRAIAIMKWKVVVVGKPALTFARLGAEEYLKRLRRYASVELAVVKATGGAANVEERLLEASEGHLRIALDERGEIIDTERLRETIAEWEVKAVRKVAWLIGGADGLGDRVRAESDRVVALGRFTFQHELALVILLEQLYRVCTLQKGEPYHR